MSGSYERSDDWTYLHQHSLPKLQNPDRVSNPDRWFPSKKLFQMQIKAGIKKLVGLYAKKD